MLLRLALATRENRSNKFILSIVEEEAGSRGAKAALRVLTKEEPYEDGAKASAVIIMTNTVREVKRTILLIVELCQRVITNTWLS